MTNNAKIPDGVSQNYAILNLLYENRAPGQVECNAQDILYLATHHPFDGHLNDVATAVIDLTEDEDLDGFHLLFQQDAHRIGITILFDRE